MHYIVAKQTCFSKQFAAKIRWHSFMQSANQHNYNTTLFTESQKKVKKSIDISQIFLDLMKRGFSNSLSNVILIVTYIIIFKERRTTA